MSTAPESVVECPALVISAPGSGHGKTLLTAALARRYRQAGYRVQVCKTGPDFLDPMILQQAAGRPVYQLDWFMGGLTHCQQLLYEQAQQADILLIEGMMGLFDGQPSTADMASQFDIPVLVMIDAGAMAQTFGAVAWGLQHYHPKLRLHGVMANRVASAQHAEMLQTSLRAETRWCGALPRDERLAWPERHLGVWQAHEITDLDARLDAAAQALDARLDQLPATCRFTAPAEPMATLTPLLKGRRIAVARDAAFSFIYPANIDVLLALGAEIVYFSPLTETTLPVCDAIWLPGGYPELHLEALAHNTAMQAALREHHAQHKPILAECGGLLYLAESLQTSQGECRSLVGLIPAKAVMQTRLAALGMHRVQLASGELRGHTFHFSRLEFNPDAELPVLAQAQNQYGQAGEMIYQQARLTASYMHFYGPSNPLAWGQFFLPC